MPLDQDTFDCILESSSPSIYVLGSELITDNSFDDPLEWTLGANWDLTDGILSASSSGGTTVGTLLLGINAGFYQVTVNLNSIPGDSAGVKIYHFNQTEVRSNVVSGDGDQTYITYSNASESGDGIWIEALGPISINSVSVRQFSLYGYNSIIYGRFDECVALDYAWEEGSSNSPAITINSALDSLVFSPGIQYIENKNGKWDEDSLYYFSFNVKSATAGSFDFTIAGEQSYTISDAGIVEGMIYSRTRISPSQSIFSIDSTTFDGEITDLILRPYLDECDSILCDAVFEFGTAFWTYDTGWAPSAGTLVATNVTGSTRARSSNYEGVAGEYASASFTVSGYGGGTLYVYIAGELADSISGNEVVEYTLTDFPTHTGYADMEFYGDGFTGVVSDLRLIKYVIGNENPCTVTQLWGITCPYTPPPVIDPDDAFILEHTFPVSSSYSFTLNIAGSASAINCFVNWGDESVPELIQIDNPSHTYDTTLQQVFIISINGYCPKINDLVRVSDILAWGNTGFEDLEDGFKGNTLLRDVTATDGGVSTFTGVTTFDSMFYDSFVRNINVTDWDTSNVEVIYAMFYGSLIISLDGIGTWDTSKFQNTSYAFHSCTYLNCDLSSWDVGNVIDARSMFDQARAISFSIGDWDTSNLMYADSMFESAYQMRPEVYLWNIPSLTSAEGMLSWSGLKCDDYGKILENWSRQKVRKVVYFGNNYFQYYHPKYEPFRETLINRDKWLFSDKDWPYSDTQDYPNPGDYCIERYTCLSAAQNTMYPEHYPYEGLLPVYEANLMPTLIFSAENWSLDPNWILTEGESGWVESTAAGGFAVCQLENPIVEVGVYQIVIFPYWGGDGFKMYFPTTGHDPIEIGYNDDLYIVVNVLIQEPVSTISFESIGVVKFDEIYINKIEYIGLDMVLYGAMENIDWWGLGWYEDPLNDPAIGWNNGNPDGLGIDRDGFVFSGGIRQNLYNRNRIWDENTLYYFNLCIYDEWEESILPFSVGGGIFHNFRSGNSWVYQTISGVTNSKTRTSDIQSVFNIESTQADIELNQVTVRPYNPACDNLINDGYFLCLDTFWNLPVGFNNEPFEYPNLQGKRPQLTCTDATGLAYTKEHNCIVFEVGTEFKYHLEVKDYQSGHFDLLVAGSDTIIVSISADGIYEGIVTLGSDQTYDIGFDASGFTGNIYHVWLKKYPECDSGADCSFSGVYEMLSCNPSGFDGCGGVAYSANPSLILADFVRSSFYGEGATINQEGVLLCAAANDELVDDGDGGTEKRREIGYIIDSIADTQTHKEDIRKYASCFLTYEDGMLKMIPDRPTDVVAFAFDETSIITGSLKLRQRTGRETVSSSRVKYTKVLDDSGVEYDIWRKGYATDTDPDATAGLIPWRETNINMNGIQKLSPADREATEILNRSKLIDLDVSFTGFDPTLKVQLGDVITVTHPIGLVDYKFRVSSVQAISAGRYKIQGYTYDANVYAS